MTPQWMYSVKKQAATWYKQCTYLQSDWFCGLTWQRVYTYEKSFKMCICLWPEFDSPEVTLCGWQDIKIHLLLLLLLALIAWVSRTWCPPSECKIERARKEMGLHRCCIFHHLLILSRASHIVFCPVQKRIQCEVVIPWSLQQADFN